MKTTERSFGAPRKRALLLMAAGMAAVLFPLLAAGYVQTNLVSDIPGLAANTDPNLQNPWGVSYGPTDPFRVSDNRTGLSTLYNGSGTPLGQVVTIPPPAGGTPPSAPTGQVFNAGPSFELTPGNPASFVFAAEDGTISGWNSGTNAVRKVDNSASGAVYKGLAIGNNGSGDFLYAANFSQNTIDVFGGSFSPAFLLGSFTEPNLPAGFAPFNIQNIGGHLLVTYAKQGPGGEDDEPGAGNGFVDVYDLNGSLEKRLITQGVLNSPWGLALAPAGFGEFGGDLLVGNFGDGRINAFDPVSGAFEGTLRDAQGNPIVNEGLWALIFGNGGNGGDPDKLYFTAGIAGDGEVEDHGLFGVIAVPEPGSLHLIAAALFALAFVPTAQRRRRERTVARMR
jgi:uncharacterized protein (TIGR03118 family)